MLYGTLQSDTHDHTSPLTTPTSIYQHHHWILQDAFTPAVSRHVTRGVQYAPLIDAGIDAGMLIGHMGHRHKGTLQLTSVVIDSIQV